MTDRPLTRPERVRQALENLAAAGVDLRRRRPLDRGSGEPLPSGDAPHQAADESREEPIVENETPGGDADEQDQPVDPAADGAADVDGEESADGVGDADGTPAEPEA